MPLRARTCQASVLKLAQLQLIYQVEGTVVSTYSGRTAMRLLSKIHSTPMHMSSVSVTLCDNAVSGCRVTTSEMYTGYVTQRQQLSLEHAFQQPEPHDPVLHHTVIVG
jgi:hypothetical protein